MLMNQELLSTIVEKLTGEATILQNVINSGKEDLYSELAQFLIFGSLRSIWLWFSFQLIFVVVVVFVYAYMEKGQRVLNSYLALSLSFAISSEFQSNFCI